jgi:hypothetical protein
MKTEAEVRRKFASYFLDLCEENAREGIGATSSKAEEWRFFVDHFISEGQVPPSASRWKCPRNLQALLC